jgi:hypothetical protein
MMIILEILFPFNRCSINSNFKHKKVRSLRNANPSQQWNSVNTSIVEQSCKSGQRRTKLSLISLRGLELTATWRSSLSYSLFLVTAVQRECPCCAQHYKSLQRSARREATLSNVIYLIYFNDGKWTVVVSLINFVQNDTRQGDTRWY